MNTRKKWYIYRLQKLLEIIPVDSLRRYHPAITYYTGRRTDRVSHKPFVLIAQPRSGTHWLRQMLEALPGVHPPSDPRRRFHLDPKALYRALHSEPPGTLLCDHLFFAVCAHTLYECGIQPILLIRDPRDVLVSQMYYLYHDTDLDVRSPSIWKPLLDAFVHGKEYDLPGRGLHTFRSARWRFLNQAVFWLDFPGVFVVRYENLMANTVGEMNRITSHLKLNVYPRLVEEIVARFDFTTLSEGRNVGQENPKHHYRRGVVGDWKEKLDQEDVMMIEEAIGDLIARLGYTTTYTSC